MSKGMGGAYKREQERAKEEVDRREGAGVGAAESPRRGAPFPAMLMAERLRKPEECK